MRALILLLCLIPTLANAKSKAARTCRIVFASASADTPEKLYLFDGTSSQEVDLSRMNFSPVYKLPAGELVVRMFQAPVSKPKDASPDAPSAVIAAAATDIYLIVTSDPDNKTAPVKIQVIDATQKSRSKGQMIWLNLTANTVNGKVGSQQLSLSPNSELRLAFPADKMAEYPVDLTFRMPDKDTEYPLCETKWSHDSVKNNLLIVVMKSDSRAPRIMAFPDQR